MKRAFLGDSYDAVKRMWQELLVDSAPLFAEPRFIPESLRHHFTRLTRIPLLVDKPRGRFSILNDPDTGIRLPSAQNQREGRTHVRVGTVIKQLEGGAECVITFDQSYYRNSKLSRGEQRRGKMRQISKAGFYSFYFVSHAPFLFAASDIHALKRLRRILKDAGIPEERIEQVSPRK
jgi:hypothetical protein